MRADRAAGTEKSAVQGSMCTGTCRPQSRFSPSSILGHFRAPNSWRILRWKKMTFPLENSGYIIEKGSMLAYFVFHCCWVLILALLYLTLPAACLPIYGLKGPLSVVVGPSSDQCSCCIIAVLPNCHSSWDTPMGMNRGSPQHDRPGIMYTKFYSREIPFSSDRPA